MNDFSHLDNLAARVRQGEREAANRLHQLLAPQMVRLVRRALRQGAGSSPLDERILAEAQRALEDNPDQRPPEGEALIRQVAQRLCDNLLRRATQPGAPTRCLVDTVRT
ncbi:MAG: hypothetical protein HYS12_19385 [Planctomycetes bacterium]|nr:hypothetical protein [Planctomycetota bacterium]